VDRVSIGGTIWATFGFVATAWSSAPAAMTLVVVMQAIWGLVQRAVPGASGAEATLLLNIPALLLAAVAFGALYRIGLKTTRASDPDLRLGPGGVQWTPVEWRVLGANVLLGVFFVVLMIVLVIVWAFTLGVVMIGRPEQLQALGKATTNWTRLQAFGHMMLGPGGIVTAAILLPAGALLLWLSAKLSLFAILAADTRSFDLGQAWSLTRGATWALLLTSFAIFVIQFLLGAFAGALFGGVASAAISTPLLAGMQTHVYAARRSGSQAVAAAFS
jgi:hypothetical protein